MWAGWRGAARGPAGARGDAGATTGRARPLRAPECGGRRAGVGPGGTACACVTAPTASGGVVGGGRADAAARRRPDRLGPFGPRGQRAAGGGRATAPAVRRVPALQPRRRAAGWWAVAGQTQPHGGNRTGSAPSAPEGSGQQAAGERRPRRYGVCLRYSPDGERRCRGGADAAARRRPERRPPRCGLRDGGPVLPRAAPRHGPGCAHPMVRGPPPHGPPSAAAPHGPPSAAGPHAPTPRGPPSTA